MFLRAWLQIFSVGRTRGKFNSDRVGGTSTRKRGWNGKSMRSPAWASFRSLLGCSPTRAHFFPTLDMNIFAAVSVILSAKTWNVEKSQLISILAASSFKIFATEMPAIISVLNPRPDKPFFCLAFLGSALNRVDTILADPIISKLSRFFSLQAAVFLNSSPFP